MKPLIVLLLVFVISLFGFKLSKGTFELAEAGRIAMSAMLLFTAIGHFAFSKGMAMMVPDFIPNKVAVVYLTGLLEVAAAIGLFVPALRVWTGWLLILFLILVLPANIQASIKQINYQKGTLDGPGLSYLWFRVPLQLLFIAWTYLVAVR